MADEGFKRKLAAILSADVEGYSRLMGDDEEATVRTLKAYRAAINDLVQQYRGRIVDSPGDNIMAEFGSVVDAVNCAVELQRDLAERNTELADNRQMQFRISVNLGDVIEDDGNIYGDGVNIAARVESLAEAGGICISGRAYDQVLNKLGLEYESLGEHQVKNISVPIRVYRVLSYPGAAAHRVIQAKESIGRKWRKIGLFTSIVVVAVGALAIWQFYLRRPTVEPASVEKMAFPLPHKPSIAVLPFDNSSGNQSQEYIADGLSAGIISSLSKIPAMLVIARTSTFVYKGKAVKVNQVAEDLGVKYVLEGSVQKSGETLRVAAQLVDALKGHYLWSEIYDRNSNDLFSVQDDITRNIVVELQIELTEGEQARVWHTTEDFEAWGYATKGIALFQHYTKEKNDRSRELFKKAVALDPNYAFAWVSLAWTYLLDFRYGWGGHRAESLKKGIEFIKKASALDNALPEIHSFWNVAYLFQGQYEKAIAEGKQAIALGPSDAASHMHQSMALHFAGNFEESIFHANQAMRLSPNYPTWHLNYLAMSYCMAGEYEKAVAPLKKAIERAKVEGSQLIPPHINLVHTYVGLGQIEEANRLANTVLELSPTFSLDNWQKRLYYKKPEDLNRHLAALRNAGLPDSPPLPLPDKPSIAVLAFDNLSGDPEQEYFSDGISENIITALSKVGELFVIARNSSFTYKGKPVKVQQIRRELGVRYVLEGSVQKSGDRVRINAQLIDAKNGQHLWAENYDRDLNDIFEIQDGITKKIVTSLRINLSEGEQARIFEKQTKRFDVFLKHTQAASLARDDTEKSLHRFGQLAQEIINIEPESTIGYRLSGWYHWGLAIRGISPRESIKKSFTFAQKALSRNESDSMSHTLLGSVYLMMRKYEKAIESGKQAVKLDPNGSMVHGLLGITLSYTENMDDAFAHLKQAIRLNPFPPHSYYFHLGRCYRHTGQYENALSEFKKAIHRNPNSYLGYLGSASANVFLERQEEAETAAKKVMEMNPKFSIARSSKAWPYKNPADLKILVDALRKAGLPK